MGSFSSLNLGKFEIDCTKNSINFLHSKLYRTINKITKVYNPIPEEDSTFEDEIYSSNIEEVILRLDLLGFDLINIEYMYNKNMKLQSDNGNIPISFTDFYNSFKKIDLENFDNNFNNECCNKYDDIPAFAMTNGYYLKNKVFLSRTNKVDFYFWENINPYWILRIIIEENKKSELKLEWDYMSIILGGYEKDQKVYKGLDDSDKFWIITEGKSDTNILKKAIENFYPSISDFFEFIDMRENYPFTGTGELFKFLQGINKLKILNKAVIIFDNDTAGCQKYEKTSFLSLIKNIRAIKLPILEELKSFKNADKTIEDINGKAVSIECFLDLTYKIQTPAAIKWSKFEGVAEKKQGSLVNKDQYTKYFLKNTNFDGYDIRKIILLINYIISECENINYDLLRNN